MPIALLSDSNGVPKPAAKTPTMFVMASATAKNFEQKIRARYGVATMTQSHQRYQNHVIVKFEAEDLRSAYLEPQYDRKYGEHHEDRVCHHHGARFSGKHGYRLR